MRHFNPMALTLATALSLCACASTDTRKDDADTRSYRNQRAVAESLKGREEAQAQQARQAQQETSIERAGGSPIPH